mgnify:CR=1 FL=1
MNRSSFLLPVAAAASLLLASSARLYSEAPEAPKTPLQMLQELKASNEALLQKQQQTLKRLEELKTQADQLRIFTKRS